MAFSGTQGKIPSYWGQFISKLELSQPVETVFCVLVTTLPLVLRTMREKARKKSFLQDFMDTKVIIMSPCVQIKYHCKLYTWWFFASFYTSSYIGLDCVSSQRWKVKFRVLSIQWVHGCCHVYCTPSVHLYVHFCVPAVQIICNDICKSSKWIKKCVLIFFS